MIFVSIASYIDPELRYTILDCINKAKRPKNLLEFVMNAPVKKLPILINYRLL